MFTCTFRLSLEKASVKNIAAIMKKIFDRQYDPNKIKTMLQDKYGPQACLTSCVLSSSFPIYVRWLLQFCLVLRSVLSCFVLLWLLSWPCIVSFCPVLSCLSFVHCLRLCTTFLSRFFSPLVPRHSFVVCNSMYVLYSSIITYQLLVPITFLTITRHSVCPSTRCAQKTHQTS